MKKFLMIIAILFLTCACSGSSLKKINIKTLNTMLDKKETFILYLTDEEEGKVLKNTLSKVSKSNNITSYFINTKNLSKEDENKLKERFTFEETNLILFIKKGQEETVLSRIDNLYISEKDLENDLKNQGYIKK